MVAVVVFMLAGLVVLLSHTSTQEASAATQSSSASLIAPSSICPDKSAFKLPASATLAMACMTNYARRKAGRPKYRVRSDLGRSATRKAADILRCDSFSHTACGRPFSYWINRSYTANKRCWLASENIAWGTGSLSGVRSVFAAWMRSPSHRSAILSRQYSDLGIGLRTGRMEQRSGAAVWVQHFGKLC